MVSGSVDISGQPSGTNMKYKIETEFKIDFDDGTNADCLVLQSQNLPDIPAPVERWKRY